MNRLLQRPLIPALVRVVAGVLGGLVIMVVILSFMGANPGSVLGLVVSSTATSRFQQSDAVLQAVPIVLIALGTCVCFRARFWNIGGEAYFYSGALVAMTLGLKVHALPSWLLLPLMAALAGVVGAVLSGIAGLLRAYRRINEVVVTLMMNLAVVQVVAWAVRAPLADPTSRLGYTAMLPKKAQLAIAPVGLPNIHVGVFVAIAAIVAVAYLLRQARLGHRIQAIGANYDAATASGVDGPRTIVLASLVMGFLGGLAGMLYVCGTTYRLYVGLSPAPGFGYIAILTALLGALGPVGSAVATLFYTLLNGASDLLQVEFGIQHSFIAIIFALILVFVLATEVFIAKRGVR